MWPTTGMDRKCHRVSDMQYDNQSGDEHDCTGTWIQKRADLRELTADAKAKAVTTVNVM